MSDSESWGADFDAPATPVKLTLPGTPQQSAPLLASPRADADVDESWEASFDASFETNALDNTPTLVVSALLCCDDCVLSCAERRARTQLRGIKAAAAADDDDWDADFNFTSKGLLINGCID